MASFDAVSPKNVRYIKLGQAGAWEKECLNKGIIRIGFGGGHPERFGLCTSGRWKKVTESFVREGKDKTLATRFTKELRRFFEDDGSTLWITFAGERLYWGFADDSPPTAVGGSVSRRIRNGWQSSDRRGEQLTKDRLSGALTEARQRIAARLVMWT